MPHGREQLPRSPRTMLLREPRAHGRLGMVDGEERTHRVFIIIIGTIPLDF